MQVSFIYVSEPRKRPPFHFAAGGEVDRGYVDILFRSFVAELTFRSDGFVCFVF